MEANFKIDDCEGRAHRDATTISILMVGSADQAAFEPLDKLLRAVHASTAALGITEAVIDLRTLEFMSSSCFKSFVSWIAQIQDLEPPRQYKLRFLSNPKLHWQKRSLRTLATFAADLISVE